jgi:hypothetical protein
MNVFLESSTLVADQISGLFSLVVRAARWHAGDPVSIRPWQGRPLYIFLDVNPSAFESASAEILRYIKTFIYFITMEAMLVVHYFHST